MGQEKNHYYGTAAVLSFVFSGLGQLYNGQIVKGLIVISFTCLSLFLNVFGAVLIYSCLVGNLPTNFIWRGIAVLAIGIISICIIGIYSIVDAYRQSQKL